MIFLPIAIWGMHVHVTDNFVQKALPQERPLERPQERSQFNMIRIVMLSFLRWLSKLGRKNN
jgi:hypothetical protein